MIGAEQPQPQARIDELIRAGQEKLASGDPIEAHRLLHQAASLYPRDERVWLALLDVVKTVEDRRVCLENIVAINPDNKTATRQLRALNLITGQNETADPATAPENSEMSWQAMTFLRLVKLLLVLIACLIGLVLVITLGDIVKLI